MAQQNRLTDEQVDRMVIAVRSLSATNVHAKAVSMALEKQIDREGRRKVLVSSYSQAFELLTVFNMAMESSVTPVEMQSRLQKGASHATNPS